jgi:hypothetical protein
VLAGAGPDVTALGGEARPARLQRQAVEAREPLVERPVDPGELLLGDDVGGAPLDLGEAGIVRLLEGLEDAHDLVMGHLRLVRQDGLGLGGGVAVDLGHGVLAV